MTARRLLAALGLLALLAAAWLLLAPVPIEPVAWQPPPDPLGQAPFVSNGKLVLTERIELLDARGPEDLEILPDDTVLTGVEDGRILRWRQGILDTLADTGGRPLGLARALQGGVWVADAKRGLLHVSGRGVVTPIVSEHGGLPFRFTDDVDVAPDGWVYFTDADHRWGPEDLKLSLLEGGPNGRLLRYRPPADGLAGGELELVLDGLHYANGVAVGPDGHYLMLTETLRMRVLKVWLTPERLGEVETVVEGLPGYPDNITSAGRGVYWLALYAPRSPLKDRASASTFLRKVGARMPGPGLTRTRRHGMAVAITHTGRVLHFLDDPEGAYAPVTSVTERGGQLWLGSLKEGAFGRATAPLRVR